MIKHPLASDRTRNGWTSGVLPAACSGICVLAVLACRGDAGPGGAWDGAVRDSAGVEIVENYGAPLWPEGPGWEFTEDLRLGTAEGEPEYQFGHISDFVVLSDGRIAVADAMAHHVRVFSPEGVHERTIGREGDGPGEFGAGRLWLSVGPGDTLLVFDRAKEQANVYAPDGTWLESFSTLPREPYAMGLWRDALRSGRQVSYHVPVRLPDGSYADTLDVVLERDVHGAVLDTLIRLPSYRTQRAEDEAVLQHYFRGVPTIALCGDRVVTGLNDEYRFLVYGPDGTLERITSLGLERLPITAEDRSAILSRWDALFQENQVPAARAAEIKSALHFADAYPAYTWSVCGPEATFLVERVRPVRELSPDELKSFRRRLARPPGSSDWDVFDSEGRYLGAVQIPGTEWVRTAPSLRFVRDRATGTWYMYSIASDELDVEYIVRWRVEGRMPTRRET